MVLIKKPCLLMLLNILLCTEIISAEEPQWASTAPEVAGSSRFIKQVDAALALIKKKSPQTHQLIQQHVAIIKQGKKSGMWAYKNPPVYEMADATTFYSVSWCAGTIAHDALHAKLYRDYLNAHGKPVPDKVWTGLKAEQKCIAFQLDVLKRIGASKRELEYCATLTGDHYDVNRDGAYTWEDYFKRNW